MLRRVLIALALVVPMTVIPVPPATASTESEFVARANGARTSRGLRAYAVRSDLVAVARRQAARMAAQRRMYHNPNLGSEVRGWSAVGENVGQGPSVESIHNAFMSSSSHRDNILSRSFTEIGVGTARASNGELFVSQVFRRPYRTAYTPPPPPPPPVYRSPARASRSAPRRPVPARKPPVRKRVVVDPTPRRLRAAWVMYRKARPVDPLDRALVFVRVNQLVAD